MSTNCIPCLKRLQRSRLAHLSERTNRRRGVAAVEFAVILPIVVLLILGSIEIGRSVMVHHTLSEASRAGARIYAISDNSKADAEAIVATILNNAGISSNDYNVTFDPANHADVDTHMEEVTVTVDVDYDKIAWLTPWFMSTSNLQGETTMPADTGDYTSPSSSGDDDDNGHGNDEDGVDESNPGQGGGGPNGDDDDDA